ncbi:hypothetical protein PINS_up001792 [Pythium insidiosum]|nr:hypothetical protein PINS_up001792 [Pythium insidiosum]
MEPSFVGTPYVTTAAPSSQKIRELLDREEANYVSWRQQRKPVRHPFASQLLNAPVRFDKPASTKKPAPARPLWETLLNERQAETPPTQRHSTPPLSTGSSFRSTPVESKTLKQHGSKKTLTTRSTPTLPALPPRATPQSVNDADATTSLLSTPSVNPSSLQSVKKKLQRNLYDFHSSVVFSFAESEAEMRSRSSESRLVDRPSDSDTQPNEFPAPPSLSSTRNEASASCSDVLVIEHTVCPYVIASLPMTTDGEYERAFERDWARTDVERLVRDAVERKRIYTDLRRAYRVILLYFRHYAGKIALTRAPGTSLLDLQQIPSRLGLLEALNLPCVDPAKFGIVDAPMRRDGLVALLIAAAKMLAAHPPDPLRFRVFLAEGIELSQAIKALIHDHVMTYAQIQDPRHFRDVFLWQTNDDGIDDRAAKPRRRRLDHLLVQHDAQLSSFFSEMIQLTASASRQDGSSSAQSRTKASTSSSRGDSVGMCFPAFVTALTAIDVVKSRLKAPSVDAAKSSATPMVSEASSASSSSSAATATATAAVFDESRAMRIFLSCLTVSAEPETAPPSSRLLTYPQFIEALLRVALQRHEALICQGRYDDCAGQLQAAPCECRGQLSQSLEAAYDMTQFDVAVEELFVRVHAYRMTQTRKRAVLKMSSLRAIHRHEEPPQ